MAVIVSHLGLMNTKVLTFLLYRWSSLEIKLVLGGKKLDVVVVTLCSAYKALLAIIKPFFKTCHNF